MKSQVLFFSFFLLLNTLVLKEAKSASVNAIYDLDDRLSIEEENSGAVKQLAQGVGLIFQRDLLETGPFYSKINATPLDSSMSVCEDVKYKKELTLNSCTGFLISDDLMVTAGHCFQNNDDCQNKAIAFEVDSSNQKEGFYKVSNRHIYQCSEIIKSEFSEDRDFAVIRLNRKTARPFLKFRKKGLLTVRDSVFMLGHPMGQPLKKSLSVKVGALDQPGSFKAPLDSFAGNSGSPVINSRTLLVEGILVRGEEDFLLDEINQCYRYQVYRTSMQSHDEPARGEGVTRISEIFPFLPN